MSVFRFFDPNPPQWTNLGQLCAFGTLVFFENNTTTPKSVYGEESLSTDLGNEIALDASARPASGVDIWCDGEYSVQLLDGDGAQVWLKDDYRAVDASALPVLPDPSTGDDNQVVGIIGGLYALLTILLLPDPDGFSNGYLATDGVIWYPATFPAAPSYDADNLPGGIDQTSTTIRVGNMLIQTGTGSAPPNLSGTATSVGVTFGTAFDSAPVFVGVTPTIADVTGEGAGCASMATSITASGFTANFFAGAEDNGGVAEIDTSISFQWFAMGIKAP